MRTLDMLVIALGHMIQYKKYHARHESPFPIDHEVAEWVLEYAEKRGIVGEGKPYDKRALVRRIMPNPLVQPKESRERVVLTPPPEPPQPPEPQAGKPHRVILTPHSR
jgi:hypothetical protein